MQQYVLSANTVEMFEDGLFKGCAERYYFERFL